MSEKIALSISNVSEVQCQRVRNYLRMGAYSDYQFAGQSLLQKSIASGNQCGTKALIEYGASESELSNEERKKLKEMLLDK